MVTPAPLRPQTNHAPASSQKRYIPTVLDLIGNTPLVRVQNIDTGPWELFLKLENQNPGGSIKDRIALSMINAAEHDGLLHAGGTLVEATAGNTGLISEAIGEDPFSGTNLFVETENFSDRVMDIGDWSPPVLPWIKIASQSWTLPDGSESAGIRIGTVALGPRMARCDGDGAFEAHFADIPPKLGKELLVAYTRVQDVDPVDLDHLHGLAGFGHQAASRRLTRSVRKKKGCRSSNR